MSEPKIAAEVAEQDFDRFVEAMDLDFDLSGMDEEDAKSFKATKRTFIRAIQNGRLIVDEKGQPIFRPRPESNIAPLTFYRPKGSALMAMDGKKKGHDIAKTYAVLAEITRQPEVTFANMDGTDVKVCQAVMVLFLA